MMIAWLFGLSGAAESSVRSASSIHPPTWSQQEETEQGRHPEGSRRLHQTADVEVVHRNRTSASDLLRRRISSSVTAMSAAAAAAVSSAEPRRRHYSQLPVASRPEEQY